MKTITIDNIRAWKPCYDPGKYLPEGWQGTALDILNLEGPPAKYKLWIVLREKCINAKTLRLFAVWCARQALARVKDPDPRSLAACDVAERYANGKATNEELSTAWVDAWAATWDAAGTAARDSAQAAAGTAARDAQAAARDSAQDDQVKHQVKHLIAMLSKI